MESLSLSLYTDQNLRDLSFVDKWPLLINSLVFMVTGMLILVFSWRSRKITKTNALDSNAFNYFLMNKTGAN